jgi:O-antigen/teichoic acid export membrane protein
VNDDVVIPPALPADGLVPAPPEPVGVARPAAIARRSVWGLIAQFTPLAVNIALTPYVIHGFGLPRYGVFLLITGFAALLGQFDGGITASAQRYFSIFAGTDDRTATTRLLTTTVGLVGALGTVIGAVFWIVAGTVARLLHMPAALIGETTTLIRIASVILVVALLRNIPAAVLQANNRFALTNMTYAVSYVIYVVGIVLTVRNGWGLAGAGWTIAAQQLFATLVLVPSSGRYLTRRGVGLYSRAELRELVGFSFKMQTVSLANLFLAEVDGLIIAALLPVANVALYTAGSGFAEQIRAVPTNAIGPIQTALSHGYAVDGDAGLYPQVEALQRTWVLGISGWCSAAIGAAYFGVTAWLGSSANSFHTSGIVATVLLFGVFAFLGTRVLSTALNVAGHPGYQARMSGVMIGVNVGLTLLLLGIVRAVATPAGFNAYGVYAVVAATTASQVVAVLHLERAVRRRHPVPMRSFLHDVPVVACLATIVTVAALEWLIHPYVPHGGLGLLASAIPAIPGLVLYARLALTHDARARAFGAVRTRLHLPRQRSA